MRNEMGNQNTTGLQASEQETADATNSGNEPSKALIVPTDVDELKASEQDIADATNSGNEPSEAMIVPTDADELKDVADNKNQSVSSTTEFEDFHDNKTSERRVTEQENIGHVVTERSSNPPIVPDDAQSKTSSVSPIEFEDSNENTKSDQNNMSATDDSEIEGQTVERREEEEPGLILSNTSNTGKAEGISFTDLRFDEQEISNVNTDEQGDALGGAEVKQIESVTPNTSSNFSDGTKTLSMEESSRNGEMVLINSEATEESHRKDGGEQGLSRDLVGKDSKQLQTEEDLLTKQDSTFYLDSIDLDIRRMLSEDNPIDRSSNQTCREGDVESSMQEFKMNDSEIDSYGIQEEFNQSHEEEQNREDDGLEYSAVELIGTDQKKQMQTDKNENLDYNLSLMPLENNEDVERELPTEVAILSTDIFVAEDKENEEQKLVENKDTNRERFHIVPSAAVAPVAVVSGNEAEERVELSAAGTCTVNRASEEKRKPSSYFPDLIDCTSKDTTKKIDELESPRYATEQRNEQQDEALSGHLQVSSSVIPDKNLYRTSLVEEKISESPQSESSEQYKTLFCDAEVNQKCAANESKAPAVKEEVVTDTADVSECVNVPSGVPNIENEISTSADEQQNEKNGKDKTNVMWNEKTIEGGKSTIYPSILPQSSKQESNQVCHVADCISLITTTSSERFATESSTQKLNSPQIVGTSDVAPNSGNVDSADHSTFIDAIERYVNDTEDISEDVTKNASPNHINKSQEVISIAKAEDSVTFVESTNDESDKIPLLHMTSAGSSEASAVEPSDSEYSRAPLVSLLKDKVYVLDSSDKKEVVPKKTEEAWRSPVKRTAGTSSRQKEKQKQRSSLFGNCMCCTTAIN